MSTINLGICGLGTVASGVVNIIARNQAEIEARAQTGLRITHIGARRDNPACDEAIKAAKINVSRDIFAVVDDPEVDIVLELIGGYEPAKTLVLQAIANGKHVITANKALIAVHGNEIFAAAKAKGVNVFYEAAVAGGIPIIKALREGLSANKIEWLAGIINGTGNFILTEMRDKGSDFGDVLAEAQRLGYAEADPTFDVEGIDAAHKLVILASLAFAMPLDFEACYTQGISSIEPQDVNYALELGYQIKHLGIARKTQKGIEMRVHPTLIPKRRLIANVDGVMNAVLIKGDAAGPVMQYGAGAGAEPTASAVIADVVDCTRLIQASSEDNNQVQPYLGYAEAFMHSQTVLPIEAVESAYYLRISASDKPGVLSKITQILSDQAISIEAVIQKEPETQVEDVPVILITDVTVEEKILSAIATIEALAEVNDKITMLRVEHLG